MDRWVGRLLGHLRERGLYRDALVVLTSDHGEEFAEHHAGHFYTRHGDSVYDELIRMPLIVKLPGAELTGRRVERATRTIDVMPTILTVARLDLPAGLQGRELHPMWRGSERGEDRVAFAEGTAFGPEMRP